MAEVLVPLRRLNRQNAAWAGGGLSIALLALPPLRNLLEADMLLHMLVQFPLLIAAGALIGAALPGGIRQRLEAWNRHGISGLVLAACVSAFWMIPRALDEALIQPWLEVSKFASLSLGVGCALALSWRAAGFVIQGFFLGNLLPMMTVAGWLYLESPVRLCNAYLTSQQENTGTALIWASILVAVAWLASFFTQSAATSRIPHPQCVAPCQNSSK